MWYLVPLGTIYLGLMTKVFQAEQNVYPCPKFNKLSYPTKARALNFSYVCRRLWALYAGFPTPGQRIKQKADLGLIEI